MVIFVEFVLSEAVAVLAGKIISTCLPNAGLLLLITSNHQVILWCIKCLTDFALLSINPNGAWCHVQQKFTLIPIEPKFCTHIYMYHVIVFRVEQYNFNTLVFSNSLWILICVLSLIQFVQPRSMSYTITMAPLFGMLIL